jgi:hypothetical protein
VVGDVVIKDCWVNDTAYDIISNNGVAVNYINAGMTPPENLAKRVSIVPPTTVINESLYPKYTNDFIGYQDDVAEYTVLSEYLGETINVLRGVLGVVPGVGLDELVGELTGEGGLIQAGYLLPTGNHIVPTITYSGVNEEEYTPSLPNTGGPGDIVYIMTGVGILFFATISKRRGRGKITIKALHSRRPQK